MKNKLILITITVTSDMEPLIDKAKQLLDDQTQSDVLRTLILKGLDSMDDKEKNR